MNNLLIDLQVTNFINAWRWWNNGAIGRAREFVIHRKLTDQENSAALNIAKAKWSLMRI